MVYIKIVLIKLSQQSIIRSLIIVVGLHVIAISPLSNGRVANIVIYNLSASMVSVDTVPQY